MYMHDPAHTQYNSDAGLNLPLTLLWSFEPSGNYPYPEAPIVVGDTAYVSFCFEDEPSQVYALDVTTGALKWSREITGYACYSSPAVADGLLYIGTGVCGFFGSGAYEGGYVYALDTATGEIVWERCFVGRADTVPVVINGRVYVVTYYFGQTLYALDALTGETIWSYTPAEYGSFAGNPIVVGDRVIYFTGEQIVAVDAETGDFAWQTDFFSDEVRLSTWYWDLVGGEETDYVYVPVYSFYDAPFHLCAIDVNSGAMVWTNDLAGSGSLGAGEATPVVANGQVYVQAWTSTGMDLYIVDAGSGATLDHHPIPYEYGDYPHMVMADGLLFTSTNQFEFPVVYALDPDSGEVLWNSSILDPCIWPAAAANRRLYVSSYDYGLLAFSSPGLWVDVSAYAGQQAGVVFYLEQVASGTVAWAAPFAETMGATRPGLGVGWPGAVMMPLGMVLGSVVLVMGRKDRRRRMRTLLLGLGAGGLLLACGGGWSSPEERYARLNELTEVVGEVDLIMGAEREAGSAKISPDGRWLLVKLMHRDREWISAHGGTGTEWVLVDLVNNVEYALPLHGSTARWLRDDLFALKGAPYHLVHVPDLKITPLEKREDFEVLEGADIIYALPTFGVGGTTLVTNDPRYPYWVLAGPELGTWLESVPSQIVYADKGPDPKAKTYSPDGRYYLTRSVYIYDAQTDELVAYCNKKGWVGSDLGWAADSSGVIIQWHGGSVDEAAANPENPIYKLLVPGATPRGTPVPVSTPTPSSEGRVPGAGQLRPVGYRPAPVAQSGEQGWYVDDVSVFDAASSPYIFHDDFDRPDSTDLGPDWVEEEGEWDIVDEQLHAQVNGAYAVGTTDSFSETVYTLETRFRATGNLNQWYNAIALGFGVAGWGDNPTGYSVAYIPAWGKLKLTREYTFLDQASVTLIPGQWYQLKVVRDGATGSIEVYLDQGQGYPDTPTLQATDASYPELRRLGWTAGGSGFDFYVDWVTAIPLEP